MPFKILLFRMNGAKGEKLKSAPFHVKTIIG